MMPNPTSKEKCLWNLFFPGKVASKWPTHWQITITLCLCVCVCTSSNGSISNSRVVYSPLSSIAIRYFRSPVWFFWPMVVISWLSFPCLIPSSSNSSCASLPVLFFLPVLPGSLNITSQLFLVDFPHQRQWFSSSDFCRILFMLFYRPSLSTYSYLGLVLSPYKTMHFSHGQ